MRVLSAPAVRALIWLSVVGVISVTLIMRWSELDLILPRLAIPRVTVECVATRAGRGGHDHRNL